MIMMSINQYNCEPEYFLIVAKVTRQTVQIQSNIISDAL